MNPHLGIIFCRDTKFSKFLKNCKIYENETHFENCMQAQ